MMHTFHFKGMPVRVYKDAFGSYFCVTDVCHCLKLPVSAYTNSQYAYINGIMPTSEVFDGNMTIPPLIVMFLTEDMRAKHANSFTKWLVKKVIPRLNEV